MRYNSHVKYLSEAQVKQGAAIVRGGGLVAFRTETVYGLGADATNEAAVAKIFEAKGRPSANPLIVHFASVGQLRKFFPDIDPVSLRVVRKIKRAITVVVERCPALALAVSAGHETVAVRVPACRFTRRFIRACGVPLAAPSANTSGRPSSTRAVDVAADLDGKIDAVFMGRDTKIGVESTVVQCEAGVVRVLRLGGVSTEELRRRLRCPVCVVGAGEGEAVVSPGRLFRHYMPVCPMYVALRNDDMVVRVNAFVADKKVAVICLSGNEKLYQGARVFALGGRAARVARGLFMTLREAEKVADVIVCEQFPDTPDFAAVNERIMRAADGKIL